MPPIFGCAPGRAASRCPQASRIAASGGRLCGGLRRRLRDAAGAAARGAGGAGARGRTLRWRPSAAGAAAFGGAGLGGGIGALSRSGALSGGFSPPPPPSSFSSTSCHGTRSTERASFSKRDFDLQPSPSRELDLPPGVEEEAEREEQPVDRERGAELVDERGAPAGRAARELSRGCRERVAEQVEELSQQRPRDRGRRRTHRRAPQSTAPASPAPSATTSARRRSTSTGPARGRGPRRRSSDPVNDTTWSRSEIESRSPPSDFSARLCSASSSASILSVSQICAQPLHQVARR